MVNAIPCPNPTCTHQFSSTELQTAAQVACPKCGFRMQGKGKAAPPAAPAKPAPAAKPSAMPSNKPAPAPAAPIKPAVAPTPKAPPAAMNPCPNPTCTHQFSVMELQSASQLLCPKCGFRMQGKGKPAPAPETMKMKVAAAVAPKLAAPSVASPETMKVKAEDVAAEAQTVALDEPPAATSVAAGEPAPAPAAASAALFDANAETGPLIRKPKPKSSFGCLHLLLAVFALGFAVCVLIVAVGTPGLVMMLIWKGRLVDGAAAVDPDDVGHKGYVRGPKGADEEVFQVDLKKGHWAPDNEIASAFGTRFAWKHKEHDAVWFALVVKDYVTQKPRDAEMLTFAIEKLKAHFEGLELAEKAEGVKANGIAMQRLDFRGFIKATPWNGECYMFFNNGIGYWLFVSSPDQERVAQYAGELTQKKLTLLSERRGWREQPPPTETYLSLNRKISVTVPKALPPAKNDLWNKFDAREVDENGELSLVGSPPRLQEKDVLKNAELLIFTYEKKDNLKELLKSVRENRDLHFKKTNANYTLVHAAEIAKGDSEEGKLDDVGDRRGFLIDLKLQHDQTPARYVLLAVINEADTAYGIQFSCPWESRQIWRQEFLEVLRTVRVK